MYITVQTGMVACRLRKDQGSKGLLDYHPKSLFQNKKNKKQTKSKQKIHVYKTVCINKCINMNAQVYTHKHAHTHANTSFHLLEIKRAPVLSWLMELTEKGLEKIGMLSSLRHLIFGSG